MKTKGKVQWLCRFLPIFLAVFLVAGAAGLLVYTAAHAEDASTTLTETETDIEAPTWPVGAELTADVTGNSVALGWPEATDNVGVASYNIYQDDDLVDTVSSATRSYTIGELEPATYTFAIKAVDAAVNHRSP